MVSKWSSLRVEYNLQHMYYGDVQCLNWVEASNADLCWFIFLFHVLCTVLAPSDNRVREEEKNKRRMRRTPKRGAPDVLVGALGAPA